MDYLTSANHHPHHNYFMNLNHQQQTHDQNINHQHLQLNHSPTNGICLNQINSTNYYNYSTSSPTNMNYNQHPMQTYNVYDYSNSQYHQSLGVYDNNYQFFNNHASNNKYLLNNNSNNGSMYVQEATEQAFPVATPLSLNLTANKKRKNPCNSASSSSSTSTTSVSNNREKIKPAKLKPAKNNQKIQIKVQARNRARLTLKMTIAMIMHSMMKTITKMLKSVIAKARKYASRQQIQ